MKKSVHLACLLACGMFAMTEMAQAATTWYFNEVTYADKSQPLLAPEQAVGWFTYDEISNTITDLTLSVKTVGSSTSNFTFDKSNMTITPTVKSNVIGFQAMTANASYYSINFNFADGALTSGDSQVTLTSGLILHGFRGRTSNLVSGSLTTSPVPEVGTGVAFAIGLLGLVAVARRRQA